ncbi:MAG: histidinol-phosphate transaminase [Gemmatimonadales bacterium]
MRDAYQALTAYRTEWPPVEHNLADNTNAFGSAPSAIAALAELATPGGLAGYPSVTVAGLRDALGEWLGVEPGSLLPGCGSNDLLDSAMRALADPGATVAYAAPTFVMASYFAQSNSLRPLAVPLRSDHQVDAGALLATRAPVIYLASPNNPSGTATSRELVRTVLDEAPGIVIIDEAYAEFADHSWAVEATRRPNVMVTRTFSKAWGLAGLRLGYAVGSPGLIGEVEKARGPFKVNAVAERVATRAVRNDRAWLAEVVARTRAGRERFAGRLREIGLAPLASAANFVGLPVEDAPRVAAHAMQSGIAIRGFKGLPGIGDLVRVTIGPDEIMDRLVDALEALPS